VRRAITRSPPEATVELDSSAVASAATELGLDLSRAQADNLIRYAQLLQRWNRVHNLTAADSPSDLFRLHLLDSLAIVPQIDSICSENSSILDVGSGGGLPGIPLAIVCPATRVTLVEKVAKKAAFLVQARLELGLANLDCVHARVEQWSAPGQFDAIVSRAFASLVEFVGLTIHLIAPAGHWFAMKGARPDKELDELRGAYPELVVRTVKLRVPRLAAERHLIVLHR
jgi:16S rRNA (guanine527-N7)-methyltransferase